MQIKIDAISDVTDLDYLKRRIEALYYTVSLFGKSLIVSESSISMGSGSIGFRLADLLHRNSGLVSFTIDDANNKKWEKENDAIKKEINRG